MNTYVEPVCPFEGCEAKDIHYHRNRRAGSIRCWCDPGEPGHDEGTDFTTRCYAPRPGDAEPETDISAQVLGLLDRLAHMTEARDNARAEVGRLAARVEQVRALHYAADNDVTRTPVCETCHGKAGVHECGCWASEDRQPVCGHCNEGDKGISVAWPCPTIRILDVGAESLEDQ